MLTYLLAFAVAVASIGFYAITLFLPAFRREQDLIWSGVGLFYALVLWVCAAQVRGGLLLGQIASVALIGWLGWQACGSRWDRLSEADKAQAKVITDIKEKFDQIDFTQLGEQAKGLADKAKSSAQSLSEKAKDAAGSAQELANKTKQAASSATSKIQERTTSDTAATTATESDGAASDETTADVPGLKRPKMTVAEAREEILETEETVVEVPAEVAEAEDEPIVAAAKADEAEEAAETTDKATSPDAESAT